jgi:leucine dehydrogenase
MFDHEQLIVRTGPRSGQTLIVAIHSTAAGPAAGGCRLWSYDSWQDGMADALRLSQAMTMKLASAELPFGGGKSVIALKPGTVLSPEQRRAIYLDLGDLIESLGGCFTTAEDVGTTAADLWVARERTQYVACLPQEHGGTGDVAEPTASGVFAAIEAVAPRAFNTHDLGSLRFTIIGLGQVGRRLADRLARCGATLTVTDIDPEAKTVADALGATWVDPSDAPLIETDVLVPAALGGLLTPKLSPSLNCRAIVGPANNQLSEPRVADLLAARDILWAPDFIVNAGGAVYGTMVDFGGRAVEDALAHVALIGPRLGRILDTAAATGVTPYAAALAIAEQRVGEARASRDAARDLALL